MPDEQGPCGDCAKGIGHWHGERGPELLNLPAGTRITPYVAIVPTVKGIQRIIRDVLEDDDPTT